MYGIEKTRAMARKATELARARDEGRYCHSCGMRVNWDEEIHRDWGNPHASVPGEYWPVVLCGFCNLY